MKLPTITQFYELSDILCDDLYLVANAIKAYHKDDLYFSEIMQDISCASEDRIIKYADTIDKLLNLPHKQLKAASEGVTFIDLNAYVKYLHHLLSINNLPFAPYVTECKKKIKDNSNSLFEDDING